MNNDFLTVLNYMERERGIDRETLLGAVETALLSASRRSVGPAKDLRIEIDRNSFEIRALARVDVVDVVKNPHDEIALSKALTIDSKVQIGDSLEIEVTPENFGRIAAQTAKQAIMQKIRLAEKERAFEEFKDRPGEVVSGTVRRFERSDVIVELGRAEAVMPARERVPTEEYQIGERLRAYLLKVENGPRGLEIVLSRSHPDFVRRLFELEVSEIADGTVEIKGLAREPGYRSKIAVLSHDDKVDPVGACVGMKGGRVKNIVRELSGERIDIVRWHEDTRAFVTEALAPAKLVKLEIDEDLHVVHVTVDQDQLSLAIGKKGQNARLTAKLTGWKIDIVKRDQGLSFEEKVALAITQLGEIPGIGAELAEKLVHSGFLTIEGIVAAELSDIEEIDGLNAALASQIHTAAIAAHEAEHGLPEE